MELFEDGCTLGNGDACDLAGRSLLERAAAALAAPSEPEASAEASAVTSSKPSASAIAQSDELRSRGLELLDHGCTDLENSSSCNFLGEAFLVGRFGVEVDKKRAAPLLELACERFEMTACRNLMVMYSRGDGVPRDFARAEAFREQSLAAVQQQSGVSMPDFLQERYQKKMEEKQATRR
jgi:TPR repeat protein